jgi:hypothetical protein
VRHIEHIRTKAQPRAEITLHTSRLWPVTSDALPPAETAPEGAPEGVQNEATHALDVIRAELEAVCTPHTMVRLRLTGPLTREQYHQLALREVITVGQQHAFSLDVDTSGLALTERAFALPDLGPQAEAISPARMVALVVEETLRQSQEGAAGMPDPDDVRAAGELLLARLRASGEEGA